MSDGAKLTLRALLGIVLSRYRLSVQGIHGVHHWGRVMENGRRLAPLNGADLSVVERFAILHDACRLSDGWDPGHGPRAAALARSLRAETGLDERQFAQLLAACSCHTRGPGRDADATILTCLDADRLDIPRVGMRIRTELLFTPPARDPRMVEWAGARAAGLVVPCVGAEEWGIGHSR